MTTKVKIINFGPDPVELQFVSPSGATSNIGTVYPQQVSSDVYLYSTQDLKIVEVKKS